MPDGKILVDGLEIRSSGGNVGFVARYLADGQIDETFGGGLGYAELPRWTDAVDCLEVDGDGNILIGAGFYSDVVFQLDPDGSTLSTFEVLGPTGAPLDIHDLSFVDGSLYILGMDHSASPLIRVGRFSSLGVIDPEFADAGWATVSFGAPYPWASDLVAAGDGRLYVMGQAGDGAAEQATVARIWP